MGPRAQNKETTPSDDNTNEETSHAVCGIRVRIDWRVGLPLHLLLYPFFEENCTVIDPTLMNDCIFQVGCPHKSNRNMRHVGRSFVCCKARDAAPSMWAESERTI